jgi:cytochrome b subunit of formate dehydrogenase
MAQVQGIVKTKYIVDVGLFIAFIVCFVTGILKLPGFTRFFHRASIDIPTDQITVFHDLSGVFLGLLAAVHLYLNRKWVVSVTRKMLGMEK